MGHFAERTQLVIRHENFLIIALAFFLIPWQWILAWISAVLAHEAFHYIVMRLCRCTVWQIDIGLTGTVMQSRFDRPWTEFLCAVAGPLGSLCLCMMASILPRVAVCGYIHFLFNLLPIYPNDGGRILKVLIEKLYSPEKSEKILLILNGCVCCFILMGTLLVSLRYALGLLPVAVALTVVLKTKKPCKERLMRVQ